VSQRCDWPWSGIIPRNERSEVSIETVAVAVGSRCRREIHGWESSGPVSARRLHHSDPNPVHISISFCQQPPAHLPCSEDQPEDLPEQHPHHGPLPSWQGKSPVPALMSARTAVTIPDSCRPRRSPRTAPGSIDAAGISSPVRLH
jgi:hypothetical protein